MTATSRPAGTATTSGRGGLAVVAICFATIVFDGYDLIVYGATVPALLKEKGWGLTAGEAGTIGSWALVGMLLGALASGVITDAIGRRRTMITSLVWFSVFMGLAATAGSPEIFGLYRFLGGLGLGGVIPTAVALTVEYAPRSRRNINNALMYSGYSVGGILASVLALAYLQGSGWRPLYWVGLLPLVTIVPLALRFLPESAAWLRSKGRTEQADALAARYGVQPAPDADGTGTAPLRTLFSPGYLRATLLFGIASFFGLLLVYGLNTWLPQIMRKGGYELGSALSFLLVLNIGAIAGTLVAATLAERFGAKRVTASSFGLAALAILVLSQRPPSGVLFVAVAVAGLGSVGTQILLNGFVATSYPAAARGSALGWALGVGRLGGILGPQLGGWVVGSSLGFGWNFYVFLVPAVLGAVVTLLVPRLSGTLNRDAAVTTASGAGSTPVNATPVAAAD